MRKLFLLETKLYKYLMNYRNSNNLLRHLCFVLYQSLKRAFNKINKQKNIKTRKFSWFSCVTMLVIRRLIMLKKSIIEKDRIVCVLGFFYIHIIQRYFLTKLIQLLGDDFNYEN